MTAVVHCDLDFSTGDLFLGSIWFNSQDGNSRVHDHALTEIRLTKTLTVEDDGRG